MPRPKIGIMLRVKRKFHSCRRAGWEQDGRAIAMQGGCRRVGSSTLRYQLTTDPNGVFAVFAAPQDLIEDPRLN